MDKNKAFFDTDKIKKFCEDNNLEYRMLLNDNGLIRFTSEIDKDKIGILNIYLIPKEFKVK